MLTTRGRVEEVLRRYCDYYQPRSGSVILLSRVATEDFQRGPFRKGFLTTLEERQELLRRLMNLEERQRKLLIMWYVETEYVSDIASSLGISRTHCYRLRAEALREIVEMETPTPM